MSGILSSIGNMFSNATKTVEDTTSSLYNKAKTAVSGTSSTMTGGKRRKYSKNTKRRRKTHRRKRFLGIFGGTGTGMPMNTDMQMNTSMGYTPSNFMPNDMSNGVAKDASPFNGSATASYSLVGGKKKSHRKKSHKKRKSHRKRHH